MHHHFICTVFMQSNTRVSVIALDDYKSTAPLLLCSCLLCTANVWGRIFIQWAIAPNHQPRFLNSLISSLSFFCPEIWFSLSPVTTASKEGRYCRMCSTDMVVLGVWGLLEQTVRGQLQAVSGGELGAVTHWAKGHAQCDWAVGAVIGHKLAIF